MYSYDRMMDEIRQIAAGAHHVALDRTQLARVAAAMQPRLAHNEFPARRDNVPDLDPGQLLHYYLIAGAHNFLFWETDAQGEIVPWSMVVNGVPHQGAATSYACHYRAVQRDPRFLDADYLADMTLEQMAEHYRDERSGAVTIKLLPQRLAKFNEIGNVLRTRYEGSFLTLLERAEGYLFRADGQGIVQRLVEDFPFSYGDWPFTKLIMVTMGNLYAIRDRIVPRDSALRPLIELKDPERITVGADYYRPFYLYRVGILKLSDELQERLAGRTLIPRGSLMEREIRALTILACQELAAALDVIPYQTARETWGYGFLRCRPCHIGVSDEEVPCGYRDRCYSYQEAPAMMQTWWPLVLTTNY